jgi:hypothetical protein
MKRVVRASCNIWRESLEITFPLFRIMIPVVVLVKVLKETAAIQVLGDWLSPIMEIVGLPGNLGIVWATTLLLGLYTGTIVFVDLEEIFR